MEVLGEERGLKDARVPKEGLVMAEEEGVCHGSVWREGMGELPALKGGASCFMDNTSREFRTQAHVFPP
jgi:hypothetical protein